MTATYPDSMDSIPDILKKASWIWPDSHHWDIHNSYALFRKTFDLVSLPEKAPLFITADQSYQLHINNRFVCRGPARGFQASWPFDEVDVRSYLREGRNVIAVRAHNPGFSNFQYITQGFAGLLVGAEWDGQAIVTDASWRARRQNGVSRDTVPTSLQLFCQEHVDLRVEPPDWPDVEFDDGAWTGSGGIPWNAMPWYDLQGRAIPLLEERQVAPQKLVGVSSGECAKDYRATRDVARVRSSEGLKHEPAPMDQSLDPLKVPPTGENRFRSHLIDFGKTVVGNLTLAIRGCAGGEIIDTLHVETIDEKTLAPHQVDVTHSRMAFGGRLICREGESRHTFFHPFGFRYLVVTVRGSTSPLEIDLSLNWIGYPLERKGSFASSSPDLTAIWDTCAWTQQCCSLDAYVDTPWREQAQWWGDARVQAWNTFHLNGDTRLFRRGIRSIASQTLPNGLTYGHAPTMAHSCILPDFTLIWMITLWDYYWQTGSLAPFQEHREVIDKALGYFAAQTDPTNGLVGYDSRYWLFLDWTDIFRDGYPSVLNLWLLFTLEKLAAMHRLSGSTEKAVPLEQWAERLRASLRALINPEGLVCDGRKHDGEIVPTTSIHSQVLAILTKLDPANDRTRIDRILLPYIREEILPEVKPSAYWITYVFSVLSQHGHGEEVVAFIKKHWAKMAVHGTTWENFEPRVGDESHSHAWSAHPLFHLMETIGGITQTAPEWAQIRFCPVFVGDFGGATIPSPKGAIRSRWTRRGEKTDIELSLPDGVSAVVALPGVDSEEVEGSNRWTIPSSSLRPIQNREEPKL